MFLRHPSISNGRPGLCRCTTIRPNRPLQLSYSGGGSCYSSILSNIQNHPWSSQSCPRVGWTRGSGRVGSGRVGSRFCRILAGRVRSGQHFGFISFLLIISWYLNRYESSNTTFGFIDFHRYLIYNNYLINK